MSYNREVADARAHEAEANVTYRAAYDAIQDAKPTDDLKALEARFTEAGNVYRRARDKAAVAEARAGLPVTPVEDTVSSSKTDSFSRGVNSTHTRVTREPLTYDGPTGRSFFRDLYAAKAGDPGAMENLARHNREMESEGRALSSTDTAGGDFVPPIWITNEWVTAARPGRPVADSFRSLPLPPAGDNVNLPAVSTGATVAVQTDGNSVSSTDPVTAAINAPVITIAGQVDLSRQSFERSAPGLDAVISDDLYRAYAAKVESQVLTGTGNSGQALGLLQVSSPNTVTYTATTPTVAQLYSKIGDAAQQIAANVYEPATAIAMTPTRFQSIAAATDTAGRPLMTPVGPQNAVGGYTQPVAGGPAGTIQGIPVIVTPQIPSNTGAGTNQDTVVVFRPEECYLWEGTPTVRVFEDVGSANGLIRVQIFGYIAAMPHRRPKSISLITGTGLVAPVFA